ncbi:bifunctional enoyl-CoA hydratase/phosphate acetyltransferase [Massilia scottii]|uniref:bifunctional enoyl-CoA hydratase/phosphate acetyltransferase n=1 Tax=Massilia scottii TaxID=3057166 RepID=UPI002796D4A4|nr:bifunctional enoyl-CoA hydratase/phosphate acetyltransferase [Massilia sp. CCM 9029]MDQ1829131.1 bifunctional enoyl-CoA hydratase/phosphate acetyltransferase [Massilia sp. CCM 9029]
MTQVPAPPTIENRTFDEIRIGESAALARTLSRADIELFAVMSGDVNPAHLDEEFARTSKFSDIVAHGMWGGALISTVLGTQLPGAGTIYLGQNLRFLRPVMLGDTVTVTLTVQEKDNGKRRIVFDCLCINQHGQPVITGSAEVIAPAAKISRPRIVLPEVRLIDKYARYRELLAKTRALAAVTAVVAHPCDEASLSATVEAAKAGLIKPVLVGPAAKIRAIASAAALDISSFTLVEAAHSHDAAEKAVRLVAAGDAEILMKGSLPTDELMDAVTARTGGLRTKRRMNHVYVMDVPSYPRPLLITDAALNIDPSLSDKRDIVQNAIDLAIVLGVDTPKVAILSAVETVDPRLRSTMDAAALCKMAQRGQITGGVLDGPLAFDSAVSQSAALAGQVASPVAGQADILLVPDLTSGSMLAKQLLYLADSQAAGIVLGARAPVILTDCSDNLLRRLASCAVALLLAHHYRTSPP